MARLFSLEAEALLSSAVSNPEGNTPEVPELIEITEDNLGEVEADYISVQQEFDDHLADTEKLIEAYVAIESLIEAKTSGAADPSLEGYVHAANMAVIGTTLPADRLFNPTLSVEALARQKNDVLEAITRDFRVVGQKFADNIHYQASILQFQTLRLKRLQKRVAEAPDTKKTVTVDASNYMCYGMKEQVVGNTADYLREYDKVVQTLIPVSKNLAKLGSTSFLKELKWFFSLVTLNSDEFVAKRTALFRDMFQGLKNTPGFKLHLKQGGVEQHVSDVLLGLFQIDISIPKKESNIEGYGFYIERLRKVPRSGASKEKIELQLSKKDVLELLEQTYELLDEARELGSFANRFNAAWNTYANLHIVRDLNTLRVHGFKEGLSKLAGQKTSSMFGTKLKTMAFWLRLFSQSGRMLTNVSHIVSSSVGATHNVAFGNSKRALLIAERYLDA